MRWLALLVFLAGCESEIDVSGLPSIDNYWQWNPSRPIILNGAIPGHGDTIRAIYRNDYALSYPHSGRYPVGAVMVKEIADKNDLTKLKYIAVMRKLGDDHPELTLHDGWLFTYLGERGGTEEEGRGCWTTCHKAAPRDGAWFDYGDGQ